MEGDLKVHLVTGEPVDGSRIPAWRGSYRADWSWCRTACGNYVREGDKRGTKSSDGVTCQSCLRTHAADG